MSDEAVATQTGEATGGATSEAPETAPAAAPETTSETSAASTPAEAATKAKEERSGAIIARLERENRAALRAAKEASSLRELHDALAKENAALKVEAAKAERARQRILEGKDIRGAVMELGVDDDDVYYESYQKQTAELATGRQRDPALLELQRQQREIREQLEASKKEAEDQRARAYEATVAADAGSVISADPKKFAATALTAAKTPGFDLVREVVMLKHGWEQKHGERLTTDRALSLIENHLRGTFKESASLIADNEALAEELAPLFAKYFQRQAEAKQPVDSAAEKTDAKAGKASTKTLTNTNSTAPAIAEDEWEKLTPKERLKRAAALIRHVP